MEMAETTPAPTLSATDTPADAEPLEILLHLPLLCEDKARARHFAHPPRVRTVAYARALTPRSVAPCSSLLRPRAG